MQIRFRISLRSSLIVLAIVSCVMASCRSYYITKKRERVAALHLISRHHGASMKGPSCPWPVSRVLGEDFFQHIRSIQMWNFQPDSVACVADLPYLESVHIREDGAFRSDESSPNDFRSLRGHRRLEDVYITAPFDDVILTHFRAPRLRRLVLYQTRVTGLGLQYIRPDRLETLTLFRSPISNQGMKFVARFCALRNLLIHGTDVQNVGLRELRTLTQLEALVLVNLDLTDEALQNLPKGLKRLYVRQIPFTDAVVEHLAGSELAQLHLIGTNITPAGIQRLREILPRCRYRLHPAQGIKRTAGTMAYEGVFFAHPGNADESF